jgi:hypothetical protein
VGRAAFCEHCKNPVFDRAVHSRDPALRQQARRGWVVLTDAMYLVRGPDGECIVFVVRDLGRVPTS